VNHPWVREILAQFRTSRAIRAEPLEKISQLGSRRRPAIERFRYSARSGQGAFTAQANGVALPSEADLLAEQDMRLHPTLSGLSISDDVSRDSAHLAPMLERRCQPRSWLRRARERVEVYRTPKPPDPRNV